MANKQERIATLIRKNIAEIIQIELKNPHLGFVSIPEVKVSKDFSVAKVYVSFFKEEAVMTDDMRAFIEDDRKNLLGDFCRGCGYCMPCTVDIQINQCARMSQLIRRSPSENFKGEFWQGEMSKIENCVDCGLCKTRCPYGLDTPNLLRKNLADYKDIIAGKVEV